MRAYDGTLLARDMPKDGGPTHPKQRTKNCDPYEGEVRIGKACWVPVKVPGRKSAKDDCPAKLYKHDGECWKAAGAPDPMGAAIER